MNYRPYPDADRARHQVERHHPRVVVTIQPDGRAFGEALRRLFAALPTAGAFAANATASSRSVEQAATDAEALRQATIEHPRRTGKTTITAAIAERVVEVGEHVHVTTRDGLRCAGGDPTCSAASKEPDR
ncbi:hypothetical protein [Streptomyces sp. T028]|uniref:hypothetical protein n=1 Tax=Streptomyces sp. T028 TaxID=3394379 RepID=UPI003A85A4EE